MSWGDLAQSGSDIDLPCLGTGHANMVWDMKRLFSGREANDAVVRMSGHR